MVVINYHNHDNHLDDIHFTSHLSHIAQDFSLEYMKIKRDQTEKENILFPFCRNGLDCRQPPRMDIFDARTGQLLQKGGGVHKRRYPKCNRIPDSCGFGKLTFDTETKEWACLCFDVKYFGGDFCDISGPALTTKHHCRVVADIDNLENYDVSTFNPFKRGVCVECTDPSQMIPILDSAIPSCGTGDGISADTDQDMEVAKDPCYFDALNPASGQGSPENKFVENYGCQCDYHNGYVEVNLPSKAETELISHACIKLGRSPVGEGFHRADIAFFCLKNSTKPIQVHTYERLEFPFSKIFGNHKELLIMQPAKEVVHTNDWLNRNIKPSRKAKIRRLNYPKKDWPVVNKNNLVNSYERRTETSNLSAWDLNLGRGLETKHWYETTNKRWLSNAIWGHPVVFSFSAPKPVWNHNSTLNPLGVQNKWYYGVTMKTKPGSIIRLDTRGYKQETNGNFSVITVPPDYKYDLFDYDKDYIYLGFRYVTYKTK